MCALQNILFSRCWLAVLEVLEFEMFAQNAFQSQLKNKSVYFSMQHCNQ